MGTIANRYRASQDPARFDKHQSLNQQRHALRSLSYGWDGVMGEIGTIQELRLAIIEDDERIPGRTPAESLAMVDEVLDEHRQRVDAHLAERRAKRRRIYVRVVIFVLVALVAINVPAIARLIGG